MPLHSGQDSRSGLGFGSGRGDSLGVMAEMARATFTGPVEISLVPSGVVGSEASEQIARSEWLSKSLAKRKALVSMPEALPSRRTRGTYSREKQAESSSVINAVIQLRKHVA